MGPKAPRLAALAVFFVTLAACGGSATPTPQTDIGITSDSILLGNTIAQSGPAAVGLRPLPSRIEGGPQVPAAGHQPGHHHL